MKRSVTLRRPPLWLCEHMHSVAWGLRFRHLGWIALSPKGSGCRVTIEIDHKPPDLKALVNGITYVYRLYRPMPWSIRLRLLWLLLWSRKADDARAEELRP